MGFASCKAFGRSISASLPKPQTPSPWEGAISLGLPPLVQARMLAVSHTKPLHDAVAQMADDLYGGYAPATPFLYNQEVYRQSETPLKRAGSALCWFYLSFLSIDKPIATVAMPEMMYPMTRSLIKEPVIESIPSSPVRRSTCFIRSNRPKNTLKKPS